MPQNTNTIFHRLLPVVFTAIIIISASWIPESVKPVVETKNTVKEIKSDLNPPSTIILNSCKLSRQDLKDLLQENVRKILFQFTLDANNNLILIAYGANKRNEILTGPYPTTVVPNTGIPIPAGGVLGNLEFRRGRLKELFGHREGKHERINEALINEILISPDPVLYGRHVIYKITDPSKPLLDGLPTNPSPPDNPCEDCEHYGSNNG